jgi:hypothetical protein
MPPYIEGSKKKLERYLIGFPNMPILSLLEGFPGRKKE